MRIIFYITYERIATLSILCLSATSASADNAADCSFYFFSSQYQSAAGYCVSAARQGDALSQNMLGSMYSSGDGVVQDDVRAYMWNNIAANNGATTAVTAVQRLAERMTQEQISEAQALAQRCINSNYVNC